MANLKFGAAGLNNTTPLWAKWVFRGFAIVTTAAAFVISGDPGIPDELKVRILLYLKGGDMLILGLTKLFGLEPTTAAEKEAEENKVK